MTSPSSIWERRRVIRRARRRWTAAALAPVVLALAPAATQAAAPTCNDMNVGVPHNATTPIFIDCTGGTGTGSPDVQIVTNPTKGTLNPVAGGTSTDQWVIYTPNAGQSGATQVFTCEVDEVFETRSRIGIGKREIPSAWQRILSCKLCAFAPGFGGIDERAAAWKRGGPGNDVIGGVRSK